MLSKRVIVSSVFLPSSSHTILVFHTKQHGIIPTGTPLTMASNAGGVGRNRDSEPISGFVCSSHVVNAATGQVLSTHRRQTTVPQVVTVIAGSKRQSLLMAGDGRRNVYDKKSQRYAKNSRTAFNCTQ